MKKIALFLIFFLYVININAQKKYLGIGVIYNKDSSFVIYEDTINNEFLGEFKYDPSFIYSSHLGYVIDDVDVLNYGLISFNTGMIEFESEKLGLPIIEIKGNWAKVFCFYDYYKEPINGWVKINNKIDYYLWDNFLINKQLFFINEADIIFFDSFEGNEVKMSIPKNEYNRLNYIMYPMETKENWMRVKLVIPSKICEENQNDFHKELWIIYLDNDKLPKVWFYPRGC
jgi:hypothetical protein